MLLRTILVAVTLTLTALLFIYIQAKTGDVDRVIRSDELRNWGSGTFGVVENSIGHIGNSRHARRQFLPGQLRSVSRGQNQAQIGRRLDLPRPRQPRHDHDKRPPNLKEDTVEINPLLQHTPLNQATSLEEQPPMETEDEIPSGEAQEENQYKPVSALHEPRYVQPNQPLLDPTRTVDIFIQAPNPLAHKPPAQPQSTERSVPRHTGTIDTVSRTLKIRNERSENPAKTVLAKFSISFDSASIATLHFPESSKEAKILLDTGSHKTWVFSREMCTHAVCTGIGFKCVYGKGQAEGTMYNATVQLGTLAWTQLVGRACLSEDLDEGTMGLSFGTQNQSQNENVLMNWNVQYKAFGFFPQNHFSFTLGRTPKDGTPHEVANTSRTKKLGWMFAGKPFDKSTCYGDPVHFKIEPYSKSVDFSHIGLWYTTEVGVVINNTLKRSMPVIWDTGSTKTRMRSQDANLLPTAGKYLLELQGIQGRIGSIYSEENPFSTTVETVTPSRKDAVIGMNFLSQFLIHFEYGFKSQLIICKPNRNLIYSN